MVTRKAPVRDAGRLADIVSAARASGRRALDEPSCKSLVAAYGVAVPHGFVIRSAEDVARAAARLRAPWVLKVISPDVIHKTEVGGVRVNLTHENAVVTAMAAMNDALLLRGDRVEGFLLEEMVAKGVEVVIGAVRDPSFGWLIMFGIGGIFVELLQDVAFRICPIIEVDAVEMLHELKSAAIMRGARGGVRVNEPALVEALLQIGGERGLLAQFGDHIAELDLNPLIASEHGVVAVDARVILADE
jgi:acetyl-CoA synthetase (ADP-forming)